MLHCDAVRCSVLQCAAVCYTMLLCVAVCCSVKIPSVPAEAEAVAGDAGVAGVAGDAGVAGVAGGDFSRVSSEEGSMVSHAHMRVPTGGGDVFAESLPRVCMLMADVQVCMCDLIHLYV